jgi:hypothetical protein
LSSVNVGSQTVLWRYRTPLVGGDLASMHAGILSPGIYSGLTVSKHSDSVVKVMPGEVLIEDSTADEARLVKVSFAGESYPTVSSAPKLLVLRYTWRDFSDNYAEFLGVDVAESRDVLVATMEYEDGPEGPILKSVTSASRPVPSPVLVETFFGNMQPSLHVSFHRTIIVSPGVFNYNGASVFCPGDTLTFDSTVHVNGRWDLVGTVNGTLVVHKGVEGGDRPVNVDLFPVCYVHVRPGVEHFIGSDLVDARPFLFYSNGSGTGNVTFQDLVGGFDNEFGVTTPLQLSGLEVTAAGRDAVVRFTPQSNLTNLLGYHVQVSPDGSYWFPLGPFGFDPSRPGASTSFYQPTVEIKNLPHTVAPDGTATARVYLVRVRQTTSAGRIGPWSDVVEFATSPFGLGDLAAGSVVDASFSQNSMASRIISNFNASNDRIATVPASPTTPVDNSSVDHTENADASINLSFEWVFDGLGDAYNIDGFIVYVHLDASPIDYSFGSDPGSESLYYVDADRRALIMYGSPKDKYYTLGVRAYRIVDLDIEPTGLLQSAIVKPAGTDERPYNPQVSAAFDGDIGSTVVSPPALTVLDTEAPDSSGASLTVTAKTDGSIQVDWSGFVDNGVGILGYKLSRRQGSLTLLIADTHSSIGTFTDVNVTLGASYQYTVSAYDRNGNECPFLPWSGSVVSSATVAPAAPTDLTATGMIGYVEVSFAPLRVPGVLGYRLFKSTDGGTTYPAGNNVLLSRTVFRDYNLTTVENVRYKIKGLLTSGMDTPDSASVPVDSTSFSPSVGDAPSSVPSENHIVLNPGDGSLTVSWTLVAGCPYYRVFRKRSDLSSWYLMAEVEGESRPFVDNDCESGRSYQYAVRPITVGGKVDTAPFTGNLSAVTLCTDTVAPPIPAMNVTPLIGAVRLSWITDRKPGTKYQLYRCPGTWNDLNASRIAVALGGGRSTWDYTDNFGLSVPLNFSYKMKTEDSSGNISGFSPVPTVLTSLIVPEFPADTTKILHWSFDDNGILLQSRVTDTSRMNCSGSIIGTAQWVPGKSGTMLRFNGTGHVKTDSGREVDAAGAHAISYSFWLSSFSAGRCVFMHGQTDICGLKLVLGNHGSALITLYNSSGIDGAQLSHTVLLPSGTFVDSLDSYQIIIDNTSQRLFFYKGGIFNTAFILPGTMRMPQGVNGHVFVGADAAGANRLIGDVDEFMIFASALQSKHALALHQFIINGALSASVAIGTHFYRMPGTPSTLPVPASIVIRYNPNATVDIELFWQQYAQGALPANFLAVYMKSSLSSPGTLTHENESVVVPLNLTDVGSYVFQGLSPSREYSFGIAAGRNAETGSLLTPIQWNNSLGSPVWLNVNTFQAPNFVGNIDGKTLSDHLSDYSETLFGLDSPPLNTLGKDGDLYHNTETSMEWVKINGEWKPANLGAVSVTIIGGARSLVFDETGVLLTSLSALSVDVKRNGIVITPTAFVWTTGGCLSGAGTSPTFTPSGNAYSPSNTFVQVLVTIDGSQYVDIAPVAVSREGSTGVDGKTYTLTITGGKRSITYNSTGTSPVPEMVAFTCVLTEDGVAVTPDTYAWSVPSSGSLLSSSSNTSNFTPTVAPTFDPALSDNVISLVVTYGGQTFVAFAPVAISKIGDTGTAGNYQQEVAVYYQGGATPTAPSGGTYRFSDGAVVVPTGGGVTWEVQMPQSSVYPTWRTSAIFSTNEASTAVAPMSSWSTPRIVGQNGSRKHTLLWG